MQFWPKNAKRQKTLTIFLVWGKSGPKMSFKVKKKHQKQKKRRKKNTKKTHKKHKICQNRKMQKKRVCVLPPPLREARGQMAWSSAWGGVATPTKNLQTMQTFLPTPRGKVSSTFQKWVSQIFFLRQPGGGGSATLRCKGSKGIDPTSEENGWMKTKFLRLQLHRPPPGRAGRGFGQKTSQSLPNDWFSANVGGVGQQQKWCWCCFWDFSRFVGY